MPQPRTLIFAVAATLALLPHAVAQAVSSPARTFAMAETTLPDAPLPEAERLAAAIGGLPNQNASPAAAPQSSVDGPTLKGLPVRFLKDELAVVTSPARIRKNDLVWLLPLAGASATAFATDSTTMRDVVSRNPSFNSSAATASDALRGVFIGTPVLLYGGGLLVKNEHARETGLLAGEAMVDAYVAGLAIKYVTLRERPYLNNARGHFFSGDAVSDPSFVSGHSVVVWSSAAVLAAEYSKPWQQAAIYTLATGGTLTRVLSQNHFPSDALLGSATGWLIGHYVYRAHHRFTKR